MRGAHGSILAGLRHLRRSCAPGKTLSPRNALVVWYSQTGHTSRIGGIIGREWRKAVLAVDVADERRWSQANNASQV